MVPDISQYLLKTGPLKLADLVTRVPAVATHLAALQSSGEIEIHGARDAIKELELALQDMGQQHDESDAARMLLQSLNPDAQQLQVRLSESAFGKAFKL
jgi:hypothetical protein